MYTCRGITPWIVFVAPLDPRAHSDFPALGEKAAAAAPGGGGGGPGWGTGRAGPQAAAAASAALDLGTKLKLQSLQVRRGQREP